MWKNYAKFFIIPVMLIFVLNGQGITQSTVSSPYSAFGLGKLYHANNMRNLGMGRIGIATRDYFTINVKNPASYTAFDSTSFVFEGSIRGNNTTMRTSDFSEDFSYATLDHLIFGFPVTDWWRSSFGLLPFSDVGYNVVDSEIQDNIGKVQYAFEGEGGLSNFYWGNAFRIGDHLSAGINASYLFGSIDRVQRVTFPDSLFLLNTKFDNTVTVKDIKLDFGVQYYKTISHNLNLIVGAIYRPEKALNATRDQLVRTTRGQVNGLDLIVDTVKFTQNEGGRITLPAGYGAGFSLSHLNHWLIGIDYTFDNWANFKSFDAQDSLINSHSLNIGGQLIPDVNSLSYYKRIDYRAGFRYNLSNLKFKNEQLTGFGISFGAGLPLRGVSVRGSRSMINFGVEFGRYGTLNKELIRENYVNAYIGISIYEWWFFKRRYN